jgi:cellulose synthase/poly-beta-1,6-N-acetylglucosamine synthase-like glycosyltransferase
MTTLGFVLVAVPVATAFYAYVGYPLVLRALRTVRPSRPDPGEPEEWPRISITVPAYNEESQIAETIESLLALDYPEERRQILVVSDCSSDRTDEIVGGYSDQGVELLRLEQRSGKTAAENAAARHLDGEIVINTDASIRIRRGALRSLVRHFGDPGIGLASGRDLSVSGVEEETNRGEQGYVGYEMKIRDLETSVSGIVGASGCFYAIRAHLHRLPLPESLSRDFAAALNTREQGYRAISVSDAVCTVPRAPSLKREYRRKVRTMTRGMETLRFKRALLNPFRFGSFAWMLFSHKICRWLLPWTGVLGAAGLALLAPAYPVAGWLLAGGLVVVGVAAVGWMLADRVDLPRPVQVLAYGLMGNVAAMHASLRLLAGQGDPVWEPTRRTAQEGG